MKKYRSIAVIGGVSIVLVVLGLVAAQVATVERTVESSLNLTSSVQVLSSGDLGLWHDVNGTDEVPSLQFEGLLLQAPLIPRVNLEVVFIENLSTGDLELIEPCRDVYHLVNSGDKIGSMDAQLLDLSGFHLGSMDAQLLDLSGFHLGFMCDRPGVMLAPGEMVEGRLRIDLSESVTTGGDYPFETVFGAIGSGD